MIIDNNFLDNLQQQAKESNRKRAAYCFHDSPQSNAQRLLNALEPDTNIPIHHHLTKAETYFIIRGQIEVFFYDDEGHIIQKYSLNPNDGNKGLHIPKGIWHSLNVLESSIIFEVNDGPYTPITDDDILKL